MKKILTLCIVTKDSRILLGMKKRGFGAGRWNGFGGKVEDGETIESAAVREIQEEVGIMPIVMKRVGQLDFSFKETSDQLLVHIYHVTEFTGEPVETEEMEPDWFDYDDIPYAQMWSDDIHWLPFVLTDRLFVGSFQFDRPATADHPAVVLSHELDVVDALPLLMSESETN